VGFLYLDTLVNLVLSGGGSGLSVLPHTAIGSPALTVLVRHFMCFVLLHVVSAAIHLKRFHPCDTASATGAAEHWETSKAFSNGGIRCSMDRFQCFDVSIGSVSR
jgi:hypothetical protein